MGSGALRDACVTCSRNRLRAALSYRTVAPAVSQVGCEGRQALGKHPRDGRIDPAAVVVEVAFEDHVVELVSIHDTMWLM